MLDNYDFFVMHDMKQAKWLAKLPRCCCCDEPIQDDFLYDIDGDLYCEDCMRKEFMKYVDDYVD